MICAYPIHLAADLKGEIKSLGFIHVAFDEATTVAHATAANGYILATVPVILEPGDFPGFIEAKVLERIFARRSGSGGDSASSCHIRLDENHIVDLNDPLALAYPRKKPPKGFSFPDHDRLIPDRMADLGITRQLVFNPLLFDAVVRAIRPSSASSTWFVRMARSTDNGAILIEPQEHPLNEPLKRPYGLLMPVADPVRPPPVTEEAVRQAATEKPA
jgi:hypothetical protein